MVRFVGVIVEEDDIGLGLVRGSPTACKTLAEKDELMLLDEGAVCFANWRSCRFPSSTVEATARVGAERKGSSVTGCKSPHATPRARSVGTMGPKKSKSFQDKRSGKSIMGFKGIAHWLRGQNTVW